MAAARQIAQADPPPVILRLSSFPCTFPRGALPSYSSAMLPYIVVALLLAVATFMTSESPNRLVRYGCLALLIVFVGLRYQLGYDWLGYERLFDFVPDGFDFSQYELSRTVLRTEPLYYGLNVVVKSLGGSFEALLLVLTMFNLIVIDRMCTKIMAGSQPFVWLVYFCAAMMAVQFNIIRQAAASSFVILSFLMLMQRRYAAALALFVPAPFVHVTVLMFLPVYAVHWIRPRWIFVIAPAALGLALLLSGIFIGDEAITKTGALLPEFIGSKADNYVAGFATGAALSTVSPLAVVLVLLYAGMLVEFMKYRDDPAVRIAIYLTVLALFAHTALGAFPSVWNRIMCVSLPWQLACLWRTGLFHAMKPDLRAFALASIAVAGTGVLAFQLSRPESVPFVPYRSLVQVWATGDEGDGRARALDTIRAAWQKH